MHVVHASNGTPAGRGPKGPASWGTRSRGLITKPLMTRCLVMQNMMSRLTMDKVMQNIDITEPRALVVASGEQLGEAMNHAFSMA